MKVLLIHNKYKQSGGEDYVFQTEGELLVHHGHSIEYLVFDNTVIKTALDIFYAGMQSIYNRMSARALKRKIKQFNPDIIHIHNFVPLASPSVILVAKKFNIPVILTLHNYRLICPSAILFHNGKIFEKSIHSLFPVEAILKGVYRNSIIQTAVIAFMNAVHAILGTWRNKVDLYISLTHFAKEKFIDSALSLPGNKLVVKPNSVVDYGRGELPRKNFFLFVGRLVEEKGILTLLRATKLYDFKLVIIGDGPLKNVVNDFARGNSNIRYLGFQDNAATIHYMKNCRALIFPSLWYEGLPLTILEAFSTGTIVIASKLGAMEEIIQDEINGLHFTAGDERDLVSKIIEITEHMVNEQSISENARLSYIENYTPAKNYALLIRTYHLAMALKRQSQAHFVHDKILSRAESI